MSCEVKNVILIRQGSKETVKVRLSDKSTGERLDLSAFDAGKAIFKTSSGTTIEKTLSLPGADPKLGIIEFDLESTDTAQFDRAMRDFEIELDYQADANQEIFTLRNSIEVEERL